MLSTLNLVKSLRPAGRWGYYIYPKCGNERLRGCPSKHINDRSVFMSLQLSEYSVELISRQVNTSSLWIVTVFMGAILTDLSMSF